MYFPLFVGILCLSLFCYTLLCILSSFAIILKRKRTLVALLFLSHRCIISINGLLFFLAVLFVGLQCVIVVFPDHTHFILNKIVLWLMSKMAQSQSIDQLMAMRGRDSHTTTRT